MDRNKTRNMLPKMAYLVQFFTTWHKPPVAASSDQVQTTVNGYRLHVSLYPTGNSFKIGYHRTYRLAACTEPHAAWMAQYFLILGASLSGVTTVAQSTRTELHSFCGSYDSARQICDCPDNADYLTNASVPRL